MRVGSAYAKGGSSHGSGRAYPVLVAVAGEEDIVADFIVVKVLEGSVTVGDISLEVGDQYQDWNAYKGIKQKGALRSSCPHWGWTLQSARR